MDMVSLPREKREASLLTPFDPRVIILLAIFYLVSVLTIPAFDFPLYLFHLLFVAVVIWLLKPALRGFLGSLKLILPMLFFLSLILIFWTKGEMVYPLKFFKIKLTIAREGLIYAANFLLKSILILAFIFSISHSNSTSKFLKGLQYFRVGDRVLVMLGFALRYLSVLGAEAKQLLFSVENRRFKRSFKRDLWLLAELAKTFPLKLYQRMEKIYIAMCCRGFDGTFKSMEELKLNAKDLIFLFCGTFYLLWVRIIF